MKNRTSTPDGATAVAVLFGAPLLILICAAPLVLARAFSAWCLWGWFGRDAMGWPQVPFWTCAGLMLLIELITHQYVDTAPNADLNAWAKFGAAILSPLFTLLLGWIVHFWC